MAKTIKQPLRKQILYLLPLGLGIVSLFAGVFLMEWYFPTSFTATAKDYKEVRDIGLVGYLPDTMPRSVRDLKVSWDIDFNTADATFFIALEDIAQLSKGFETIQAKSASNQRFRRERENGAALPRQIEELTINTQTGHVEWSTRPKN